MRHRRSSVVFVAPTSNNSTGSTGSTGGTGSTRNTSRLSRPPTTPPPPPPPPPQETITREPTTTITLPPPPPPLNIPSVRTMTREARQSPLSQNWIREIVNQRNGRTSLPLRTRHRVFRFSTNLEPPVENTFLNDLSPVRIRPSVSQIRRGTELLQWNDISDNYQTNCPIDLVPFTEGDSILRIRECSHIFREMNLRRHFRNSPSCPICRYDIRDYIADDNAPPMTSDDLEAAMEDSITNIVEEAVNQMTRTNRRNHSSISLT